MATPVRFACNVAMDVLCNFLLRRLAVGSATEATIHPECGADYVGLSVGRGIGLYRVTKAHV